MRRRVVVTGMGVLSAAGADLEEARPKLVASTCCLSPLEPARVAHLKARYAGLIGDFQAEANPELARFDRHVHMALVAAREALTAARLEPGDLGRRMGLIFSTCSGPMLLIEEHYERIIRGDLAISADQLDARQYHAGARVLAQALGLRGLCTTVVTACTAGTAAMALAADLIRCGLLDAALAGGSDAFSLSTLAGFDGLKATCAGKCAPFSKPYGLNLGEAAAFVVLEAADAARDRAARVHAEIAGCGMSNDAYHCSSPDPTGRGLAASMRRALSDAGLAPGDITYINAHGTGTEANDKAETRAIRKVFESQAERIPVSSTKSLLGHCLGAAGVVEAITSMVCAEAGVLPATANFTGPREGCALDYVPDALRPWPQNRTFLSNNAAFAGHNASIVFSMSPDRPASDPQDASHEPPLPEGRDAFHCVPEFSGEDGDTVERVPTRFMAGEQVRMDHGTFEETIWVTACGLVSALGVGTPSLLDGVRNDVTGVAKTSLPGLPPMHAALVNDEVVGKFDRRLDLRHMDRSSRWATAAARAALREAAFPEKPSTLAELGLYLHLATGPSWAESEYLTSFLRHNHQVNQLVAFPYIVPSSVAGNVCRALRLTGHNLTLSAGPGAGLLGLVPAIAAVRAGHTEALLTGAVDELSERILTDRFRAGLLPPDGPPPGEGAAMLLLETACHAQARGAQPLACVVGLACSTEVGQARSAGPEDRTLEETVRDALAQAHVKAEEIGTFCVSGPPPRMAELTARICPEWADRTVGVSRHTGCLEGAQPLFDLAAALLTSPDRQASPGHVLAISSSPHGVNCAVVFQTER